MKEIYKNKSALLISVFIAIILPIIYFKSTIDRVLMPRVLVLSILIVLLSVVWLVNKEKIQLGRKAGWLLALLSAYLLTSIISAFAAINGYESVFEIFKTALFILFLFFV